MVFYNDSNNLSMFRHALHNRQALTDAILNSLNFEILILDKNGVIEEANTAWFRFIERHYPYAQEKMGLGVNHIEVIRQLNLNNTDEHVICVGINNVLQHVVQNFIHEYHIYHQGKVRWFMLKVVVINKDTGGAIILHEDLTLLKQQTEQYQQTEADLQILLDSALTSYYFLNLDGTIRMLNIISQIYSEAAFQTQPRVGDHLYDFVTADELEFVKKGFNDALNCNSTSWRRILKVDDYELTLEVIFNPIIAVDGTIIGVCMMSEDMTERNYKLNLLMQNLDKERELIELKSRFVAMTSHEFKTPLAIISSSTQLLKQSHNKMSKEKIEKSLDKIMRQVEFMSKLIDEVLFVSKKESKTIKFQPKEGILEVICKDILDDMKSNAEEFKRITFEYKGDLISRLYDPNLIKLILHNLLGNALKYSPQNALVLFELTSTPTQDVIIVKDLGIGIPKQDISHLFEPFYRASNADSIQGTGLGLIVTKQAIELHGGTIEVDSVEGKGTKFIVVLPHIHIPPKAKKS
jgi:signal transduction histidine kinase